MVSNIIHHTYANDKVDCFPENNSNIFVFVNKPKPAQNITY
jgi:hypothetical protein